MSQQLTIVMYHYVREISQSKYPNIKGLEFSSFVRQLDYLSAHYSIISATDLIGYLLGQIDNLPTNACLLTFDDGYKDHITYVMPELIRRGLSGCFFPSAKPVTNNQFLDTNAIHYILATASEHDEILNELKKLCIRYNYSSESLSRDWDKYAKPTRYDPKEIVFIKKMLQKGLPEEIRGQIIKALFDLYLNQSEETFCKAVYMSTEDLKALIDNNMYVGNHTYSHVWLDSLSPSEQKKEIELSLEFLSQIGAATDNWIMCYPYGGYNQSTLEIIKSMKCIAGLTTVPEIAHFDRGNALELSRLNTNDFPQ